MTIELISEKQYNKLLDIQKLHPKLTFENKGYEYIRKSELSEHDLEAIYFIEILLENHIKGFEKFNNFCHNKDGELKIRFQYDWTAGEENYRIPFTGVGYLLVDELLGGFKESHLI